MNLKKLRHLVFYISFFCLIVFSYQNCKSLKVSNNFLQTSSSNGNPDTDNGSSDGTNNDGVGDSDNNGNTNGNGDNQNDENSNSLNYANMFAWDDSEDSHPADSFNCALASIKCVPSEYSNIQLAADATVPGDKVIVSAGNYSGFTIRITGEENNSIQYIAKPGVIINNFSNLDHGIVALSDFGADNHNSSYYVDYVHVIGFTVDSPPGRCIYVTKAISTRPIVGHRYAYNTCLNAGREGFVLSQFSRSVAEYNVIINSGNGSPLADKDHGIYLSNGGSGDCIIRHNFITGSSTAGIHFNGDRFIDWMEDGPHAYPVGTDGIISGVLIQGNIITDGGQNGLNMDGVQDSVFVNNLFYHNRRSGIRGYAIDGAEDPKNMIVINNTFIGNTDGVKFDGGSTGGHIVFNNLFVDQSGEDISIPSGDSTRSSNVSLSGEASVFTSSSSFNSYLLNISNGSNDPFDLNFTVSGAFTSQIVNQGDLSFSSISAPSVDLHFTERGSTPDIGAQEH